MAFRIWRLVYKLILILAAVYISVALLYYVIYINKPMGIIEVLKEPLRILKS